MKTQKPKLGVFPRRSDRLRVLIFERIQPEGPQMVYANLFWWQHFGDFDVNVVNVWPVNEYRPLPDDIDFRDFDVVVFSPRIAYDPITLINIDTGGPCKLKDYTGVKVLFRQDENYVTDVITNFIADAEIDIFYSCVPDDQHEKAFGKTPDFCKIKNVLTGYVDPYMRNRAAPTFGNRPIDIFYRAYLGPMTGGRLAWEKYQIGAVAKERLKPPLIIDVSLDPADRLYEDAWLTRLASTKGALGVESGSNIFDHDGSLHRSISVASQQAHFSSYADCAIQYYGEVEPRLVDIEGNVRYAQVSPRHFEAASMGAAQIMFPDMYSDVFLPGRHYIELQRDFSNLEDCVDAVRDKKTWAEITTCAFDEIVQNPAFWVENFIERIESDIAECHEVKNNAGHRAPTKQVPTDKTTDLRSVGQEAPIVKTLAIALKLFGVCNNRFWSVAVHGTDELDKLGKSQEIWNFAKLGLAQLIENDAGIKSSNQPRVIQRRVYMFRILEFCAGEGSSDEWESILDDLVPEKITDDKEEIYCWRLLTQLAAIGRESVLDSLLPRVIQGLKNGGREPNKITRDGMKRAFNYGWKNDHEPINKKLGRLILNYDSVLLESGQEGFRTSELVRARKALEESALERKVVNEN